MEVNNLNVVIVYFRIYNNVFYKFEINLVVSWFVMVDFDVFDLMVYFIEEVYKRGIEFYVWLNFYCVFFMY